jgi:hypothetical protein
MTKTAASNFAQACCPAPSNCGASCWRVGSPGRAPSAVHLHAATTAPSSIILSGFMPVVMPYITEPMNESPAPVVSATAFAGRPAAVATNTCATGLLDVLLSAVACAARSAGRYYECSFYLSHLQTRNMHEEHSIAYLAG